MDLQPHSRKHRYFAIFLLFMKIRGSCWGFLTIRFPPTPPEQIKEMYQEQRQYGVSLRDERERRTQDSLHPPNSMAVNGREG